MSKTLARPYAKALFSLANQSDQTQDWMQVLSHLANIAGDAQANALLTNPFIERTKKAGWLKDLVKSLLGEKDSAKLPEQFDSYLRVLFQANRWLISSDVYQVFREEHLAKQNQALAYIELASELTPDQETKLLAWLGNIVDSQLLPEYSIEPELMAGFRARIGGKLIEISVADRIHRLNHSLGS